MKKNLKTLIFAILTFSALQGVEAQTTFYETTFQDVNSVNNWVLTNGTAWVSSNGGASGGGSLRLGLSTSATATMPVLEAGLTNLSISITTIWGSYIYYQTSTDGSTWAPASNGTSNTLDGGNGVITTTKSLPDGTRHIRFTARDASGDMYIQSVKITGTLPTTSIVISEAGTLSDLIDNPGAVIALSVAGPLNAADLEFIRTNITALRQLDLSNVSFSNNTIPNEAFKNTTFNIILPAGITTIGISAFEGSTGISGTYSIPERVTTIGNNAYKGCTGITSLIVPNSVVSIGDSAFQNCTNLATVTCNKQTPPAIGANTFTGIAANAKLNCPDENAYIAAGWTGFLVIPSLIHITEAGSMSTLLDTYKEDITTLKVTGNIDARDFRFMRDQMTVLSVLDLSEANIVEYEGTAGTYYNSNNYVYPANFIPTYSFSNFVNSVYVAKTTLTSIVLPNSATGVGFNSFLNCINLRCVTLNEGLQTIEQAAFSGTSQLDSISLPSTLTTLGAQAFYLSRLNCRLTLPAALTSIGNWAFSGTQIKAVNLPDGLTYIGGSAFYNCISLSGSLTLPEGLTFIGNAAFRLCQLTGSLVIPSSLAFIGTDAFAGCSFNILSFQNGVTSLKAIPNGVFSGCAFTGKLIIPEGITYIGESAFQSQDITYRRIESLTLPKSLKSIGSAAFYSNNSINKVIALSSEAPALGQIGRWGEGVFGGNNVDSKPDTLYVAVSSLEAYKSSEWNEYFKVVTSGGYSFIASANNPLIGSVESSHPNNFFEENTSITLTATPKADCQFTGWYNANRLNDTTGEPLDAPLHTAATWNITLTQDTGVIAMFSNKVNTEVTAGKLQDIENISTATHLTLTGVIDARDFFFMRDNMPVLTILDLSGVSVAAYNEYPANAVPNEALYNKTRLRSVVLPIGLESIGASAFYQSANIAKVELPITITTIGNDAFYQNNISNAITIPGSIGSYAFYGNRLLKDVTFTTAAGSNAQVGSYAFFECDLQSLNLPEGVVSIGARAFEYNQNLASLTLPSSLQQIGDYAFTYNSKLTAVSSLSRNPQTVSDYAFYQFGRTGGNVRHNTKLYVPFGTASDYSDTRGWADTLAVALDDPLADFTSCDEGNGFYYFDYHGLCSYAYPEVYDWINNIIESGYAFSAGATEGKASSTVANGLYSEGIEITVTASPLVEDAGYIFDGWFVKGETEPISTQETYTFTMPSADRILTARYTLAVNANVQPNGVKDLPQILRANSLTLTGSIDARDFRFIRDNMNKLVTLDLSGVSIAAYQGADGTLTGEHEYAANKVPAYAFRKAASGLSMTFSELKLPTTTVAIGEYALYNCSNVAGTLSIPASLDAFAISGMGSLSGVEFNGNVSAGGYIGDYAMQNVPLPEIFSLPASVETIGKHAFDGTAVDSVIMPGVKNIGNNAFTGTNVTSVSMPVVESIGDSAFMGTLLGDFLYFPQSLKKIGCHAFAGLEIESLMLPDTMEYIGAYAFAGCTALDYSYSTRFDAQNMLYIPEGIDTLAEGVFTDCAFNGGLKLPASLRRIVSSYEIPAFRGSSFNGDLNMENCTDIGAYAFAEAGFTGGKLYLAKGTKTIAEAVFSDCNFTGKLELSEGFETLEAAAFMNNIMLDTLILPASLDTLGFRAFYGCTGLRYIVNLASIPQMIAKDQNAGIYYDGWFGWSGDWNVAEEDLKQYPYYLNESQVFGEIPKQFKYLDLNPSDICKLIVPNGSVAAYQDAPAWGYWTMKYVEPLNITHDYQIALDAFDSIAGGGYYLSYKANNSLYGSIISTAKNYYLHEGCVTLTAISAGSIAFKNWTDRSGNILGTESTLTIILSRDTAITANFEVTIVTVTFNTNGGDPIADREYQADDFLYGQAPNTGLPTPTRAGRFTFEGWYSNAQLTQKVGDTSTVQGVNHTLYAKWNEIPLPKYTVSITAPSNGSISVFNGSTQIANGDQVDSATVLTLEATPNSGYRFDKWWDSNTTNPREFTLEQNLTISATFKQSVDNSYIEPADLTLKLYPNPITNGVLTVEIPESFGGVGVHTDIITIYNVSGKLMLSKPANRPKTRINISHLPNGTYIVKIGEVSAKIVKQ